MINYEEKLDRLGNSFCHRKYVCQNAKDIDLVIGKIEEK